MRGSGPSSERGRDVDDRTIARWRLHRFDDGAYLRTHVLRLTWHVALPDDLRWLLELTAPRLRRSLASNLREHDVADATLERTRPIIAEAVTAGPRTRAELGERLLDAGLPGSGSALGLVVMDAELEALVCSGPVRDGAHTYASFVERTPGARKLTREEAVAELALRYLTGHGPATESPTGPR
ncbi:winged helix DNA-binding domain-containing protein [Nitriliruptoraceae bacterium ZYF776]|nr:winged helix DNA-binding domain-containing protein [Profundirhabdus halotolerans]